MVISENILLILLKEAAIQRVARNRQFCFVRIFWIYNSYRPKQLHHYRGNSSNTWSARDRESGKGDTKNNHSQLFVNSMFLRRGVGERGEGELPARAAAARAAPASDPRLAPGRARTCCPCERPAPGARSRPHVLPAVSDPRPPPARALARPRLHLLPPATDPLLAPARAPARSRAPLLHAPSFARPPAPEHT
uniref:Uncharacterized protein n=1 Tax=Ananas comosus var. bracteatus TaxID=296719 RepID=A0A6V7QNH9_ANACO|nr:unnamed protein product [Ananas comosus var. bracteatus]